MKLEEIEDNTGLPQFCFCPTPKWAHFAIRKPLMEMFGVKPQRLQSNWYTADDMIPANKSAPIWRLKAGKNVEIGTDDKGEVIIGNPARARFVISGEEIKAKQQKIDLMYVKGRISEKEVHDIQRIKAGQYKPSEEYRRRLQQKSSYIVIRAEVTQYLDYKGKLLDQPIKSVVHYTTFPKLTGESLDCQSFTKSGENDRRELKSDKESKLKGKFKSIIKLNALMAAKHQEGLSLVIPNAYFHGLSDESMKKARRIFVEAAIESAKEIIEEGKYPEFLGIFVNTGKNEALNNRIKEATDKGIRIAINHGDLSALSRISTKGKFAEPIMGDGVGPVGNGALSATGNNAVEENLTRKTLGETVLMFSGALNKKVLDKNCYRGESVQSDIVRNGEQKPPQHKTQNLQFSREQKPSQHKMQNIQCNSTVCFAIAASLAALIVALVSMTQTYIFLAAFVIPAAVGLYGWSLYKKEQENKPSSNIEGDIKVKGASHNMMHQGG